MRLSRRRRPATCARTAAIRGPGGGDLGEGIRRDCWRPATTCAGACEESPGSCSLGESPLVSSRRRTQPACGACGLEGVSRQYGIARLNRMILRMLRARVRTLRLDNTESSDLIGRFYVYSDDSTYASCPRRTAASRADAAARHDLPGATTHAKGGVAQGFIDHRFMKPSAKVSATPASGPRDPPRQGGLFWAPWIQGRATCAFTVPRRGGLFCQSCCGGIHQARAPAGGRGRPPGDRARRVRPSEALGTADALRRTRAGIN